MKRKIFMFMSLILVISCICAVLTAATTSAKSDTHDAKFLKDNFGLIFEPCLEVTNISESDAIKAANDFTNNNFSKNEIKTQYSYYTAPNIKSSFLRSDLVEKNSRIKSAGCINRIPVWIISFENIDLGARFQNKTGEENIIVDAISGEVLSAFIYR